MYELLTMPAQGWLGLAGILIMVLAIIEPKKKKPKPKWCNNDDEFKY